MEHERRQREQDRSAFERDQASVANAGTHADAYIQAVNADGEAVVFVPGELLPDWVAEQVSAGKAPLEEAAAGSGSAPWSASRPGQAVRSGRKPPKDAYGIRIGREHYRLDGQPPPATPTKPWGAPLVAVAKANAKAAQEAWQEVADRLGQWLPQRQRPPRDVGASAPGASRLFGPSGSCGTAGYGPHGGWP